MRAEDAGRCWSREQPSSMESWRRQATRNAVAGASAPDGKSRLGDLLGGVAVGFHAFARAVD